MMAVAMRDSRRQPTPLASSASKPPAARVAPLATTASAFHRNRPVAATKLSPV